MNCTPEIAWAAGLFEGEGSVTFVRSGDKRYPRAVLGMTDEDIVLRFQQIMNGGNVCVENRQKRAPHHKTLYRWQAQSRKDWGFFVEHVVPLLGPRRQAQVAAVQAQLTAPVYRKP